MEEKCVGEVANGLNQGFMCGRHTEKWSQDAQSSEAVAQRGLENFRSGTVKAGTPDPLQPTGSAFWSNSE